MKCKFVSRNHKLENTKINERIKKNFGRDLDEMVSRLILPVVRAARMLLLYSMWFIKGNKKGQSGVSG